MAQGHLVAVWSHGEDEFNIAPVKLVLDLEEKCDAGIAEVFARLREGRFKYYDVRETIRLALIGGGKAPELAEAIVRRHVDGEPLAGCVLLAVNIIAHRMIGVEGEEVGKKSAAEGDTEKASSEKTDASPAPQSTALGNNSA